MSGHELEQLLMLLKELSMLKQLDSEYESGSKTKSDKDARRRRQQRHPEIAEEIKALAAQKKPGQTCLRRVEILATKTS